MQDIHDIGEPREPDSADGRAAGEPIQRRRLTIGARATLLMGMSIGAFVAITAVLPAAPSETVSRN